MSNINVSTITGNLGGDPVFKKLEGDKRVAEFNVGVGGRNDRTEWIHVRVWNATADFAERNLRKGSRIAVTGRLTTDQWEVDGQKNSRTYITGNEIEPLGDNKAKADSDTDREPVAA